MDSTQQTNHTQQNDERFIAVLKEMIALKDKYAVPKLELYTNRKKRSMIFFRSTGIIVILLSVSIPFLTTLTTSDNIWKTFVLPIVALAIAGLTGLISFFRWESSWRDFSHTEDVIERAFWTWELSIAEARYEVDVQRAIDIAIQATKQLLDQIQVTTGTIGDEFFKRVQAPQSRQS